MKWSSHAQPVLAVVNKSKRWVPLRRAYGKWISEPSGLRVNRGDVKAPISVSAKDRQVHMDLVDVGATLRAVT